MPGVRAILTADDVPILGGNAEQCLTNEPRYAGEPILAVRPRWDEETACEAIERIEVDLEPLPFVVDPLDSLRPGGPDARLEGNAWTAPAPGMPSEVTRVKWTAEEFAEAAEGRLPMGEPLESWSFGDLDVGFAEAELVLDESFVVQSTSHHPMENAQRDGLLAEWSAVPLRIHAEYGIHAGSLGRLGRRRSRGCGPYFRVLWRRVLAARARARKPWQFQPCCRARLMRQS